MGLQAHPEFCTRPLNPSPPFLGFVAAASGPGVLQEQIENQLRNYTPPHPEDAMVSEAELRNGHPVAYGKDHVLVNGNASAIWFLNPNDTKRFRFLVIFPLYTFFNHSFKPHRSRVCNKVYPDLASPWPIMHFRNLNMSCSHFVTFYLYPMYPLTVEHSPSLYSWPYVIQKLHSREVSSIDEDPTDSEKLRDCKYARKVTFMEPYHSICAIT